MAVDIETPKGSGLSKKEKIELISVLISIPLT